MTQYTVLTAFPLKEYDGLPHIDKNTSFLHLTLYYNVYYFTPIHSVVPPRRNHRMKKPIQESNNTTFSGWEDNGDARSHLSHDSAPTPGQTPSAAGPSRKRPRASDEGPEVDSGNPTPLPRHHKEGPASKIELMFKPHPELVRGRDYNQTR